MSIFATVIIPFYSFFLRHIWVDCITEKKSVFRKTLFHFVMRIIKRISVFQKTVFFCNAHDQTNLCFPENIFSFRNAHYQTKYCTAGNSFRRPKVRTPLIN